MEVKFIMSLKNELVIYKYKSMSFILLIIFLFIFPISSTFTSVFNNYLPFTLLEKILIYISCSLLVLNRRITVTSFIIISFVFLVLIVLIAQTIFYSDNFHLSVNSFLRLTFPFIFFLVMHELGKHYPYKLFKFIKLSLYGMLMLSVISILIGVLTGLGGDIGGRGVHFSGNKGFFVGANEVGLLLLINLILIERIGSHLYRNVGLALVFFSGLFVLTKSSLVASILIIGLIALRYRFVMYLSIIILLLFFATHFNAIFIQVSESVRGSFLDLENQSIVQFLFRGRQNYIDAFFYSFDNNKFSNLLSLIFIGLGENYVADTIAIGLGIELGNRSTFEMDLFDLLFSFGVVVTALYLILLTFFIRFMFKNLLLKERLIVVFIMLHSLMAGHVIYSPLITVTLVMLSFYVKYSVNPPVLNNRGKR